jgi:hypothetical protein
MVSQVEYLTKLLDHLRSERRKLVDKWSMLKSMPSSISKLVHIQNGIDAVERALQDEGRWK